MTILSLESHWCQLKSIDVFIVFGSKSITEKRPESVLMAINQQLTDVLHLLNVAYAWNPLTVFASFSINRFTLQWSRWNDAWQEKNRMPGKKNIVYVLAAIKVENMSLAIDWITKRKKRMKCWHKMSACARCIHSRFSFIKLPLAFWTLCWCDVESAAQH